MGKLKKILAYVVAMGISFGSMQTITHATTNTKDYNGDGVVNVLDVLSSKRETISLASNSLLGNYTIDYALNFRAGAGVEYTSYCVVPQDTTVSVIEVSYDTNGSLWGKYQYKGQYGWSSLKYCSKIDTPLDDRIQTILDIKEYILKSATQEDLPSVSDGSYYIDSNGNFSDALGNVIYETNTPLLSTDMFAEYYNQALLDVQDMTLEEKVGQLFIVRATEDTAENISSITNYNVGGITLYADSFQNKSVATVKANIKSYQNASKVPLIVAVDEEGGSVVRVSAYTQFRSTPFLSPQKLYAKGGFDAIYNDTVEKAQLLDNLGINLNFAPVADVSTNSSDYIYSRTFGKNATQTAKYISTSVQAYNSQNFACTLKHFPGYGNNLNTHTGISIDTRSKESFYSSDFLPFIAGIENDAPFIMVSHNIVNCFDSTLPSSISAEVHRVLREDLNYTGIVLTDDLDMDAIKNYTGTTNACVYALQAGNDMLVTSTYEGGYNAVLNSVKNGTLSEYRIDESVIRVLAYKYCYNLM